MATKGVGGSGVDTLDNVNLTTSWPVWSEKPVSRPKTTGGRRHVGNVCNEETVVVGRNTGHADRSTTSRASRENSRVVDTPCWHRRVGNETLADSVAVAKIVNEPVSSVVMVSKHASLWSESVTYGSAPVKKFILDQKLDPW